MDRYSIEIRKYQTPNEAKKNLPATGHVVALVKNGDWVFGAGEVKATDIALALEQLTPEKFAEAFRAGALKLAEIRQAREVTRRGISSQAVATLA